MGLPLRGTMTLRTAVWDVNESLLNKLLQGNFIAIVKKQTSVKECGQGHVNTQATSDDKRLPLALCGDLRKRQTPRDQYDPLGFENSTVICAAIRLCATAFCVQPMPQPVARQAHQREPLRSTYRELQVAPSIR